MFRLYLPRVYKITDFLFNGDLATTVLETPFLVRSFCVNNAAKKSSSMVSYLIESWGFSEEKAISLSEKFLLKSSSTADKILTFFRNYEFLNDDILRLIEQQPNLLGSNADKTLKPKIEFLRSLGFSGPSLAKLLLRNPHILRHSLKKTIIPCVDFLRNILPTQSDVTRVIKRSPWILDYVPQKRLVPNIAVLQSHGVPNHSILKLLLYEPSCFTRCKRFKAIVEEATQMQFDPSKSAFVKAVQVLASLSKLSWEAKTNIYKKWGWSDEDIQSAFRKQPQCMIQSEKKITDCMEFFVNNLGYDSLVIARYPFLLMYSLEKRTIPRLSVIRVLISHDLVKKDCNVMTVVVLSETNFLKKFVTKFGEQLPQLMDIYKGKKNAHQPRFSTKRSQTKVIEGRT